MATYDTDPPPNQSRLNNAAIPTIVSSRKSHMYFKQVRTQMLKPISLQPHVISSFGPLENLEPSPPCLGNPSTFITRTGMGLIHWNIRSLCQQQKMDHLNILTSQADPDIMVITEIWLKTGINDSEVSIENYNLFRIDRAGRGGGIVIFVKNIFSATVL